MRLREAIARRNPILSEATNCCRLVDGAVDGFPGIEVECFSGNWLVQTRDRDLPMEFGKWCLECGAGSIYHKRLEQSDKKSPVHVAGDKLDGKFEVRENGRRFLIDFAAGYSQGIFLDQRENRQRIATLAQGKSVLNTFAYTCAFGVAAAAGGAAEVVNLDLSKNYLDWGRENFVLNGFDGEQYDFIYGDALAWMRKFAKRGRKFDLVILDPPTFSRDAKGKAFSVRNDFSELIALAADITNPGGAIFASTNMRALSDGAFLSAIDEGLADPSAWDMKTFEMPEDFRGENYLKSCLIQNR